MGGLTSLGDSVTKAVPSMPAMPEGLKMPPMPQMPEMSAMNQVRGRVKRGDKIERLRTNFHSTTLQSMFSMPSFAPGAKPADGKETDK